MADWADKKAVGLHSDPCRFYNEQTCLVNARCPACTRRNEIAQALREARREGERQRDYEWHRAFLNNSAPEGWHDQSAPTTPDQARSFLTDLENDQAEAEREAERKGANRMKERAAQKLGERARDDALVILALPLDEEPEP